VADKQRFPEGLAYFSIVTLPFLITFLFLVGFYGSYLPINEDWVLFESVRTIKDLKEHIWQTLITPVNDHRVLLMLLLNYVLFLITGTINLKYTLLIFNLFGIVLFYFFIRKELTNHQILRQGLALLLLLILFNPINYQTLLWSSTLFQIQLTSIFAFIAFQLIFNTKFHYLGLFLAVFVGLSNGNGFLALFVPLVIFAFEHNLKKTLTCFALLVSTLFLYFYNYHFGGQTDFNNMPSILRWVAYWFAVNGSVFSFRDNNLFYTYLAVFGGLSITIWPAYLIIKKLVLKRQGSLSNSLTAAILYILGSNLLIVAGRGWQGITQMLSHRYHVLSAFLLIFTLLAFLHTRKAKLDQILKYLTPSVILFILVGYYFYLPQMRNFSQSQQTTLENIREANVVAENYDNGGSHIKYIVNQSKYWENKFNRSPIKEAYKNATVQNHLVEIKIEEASKIANNSSFIPTNCHSYSSQDSSKIYSVKGSLNSNLRLNSFTILVLKGKKTIFFSEKITLNNPLYLLTNYNTMGDSEFIINSMVIPSGTYELEVLKIFGKNSMLYKTDKKIEIEAGVNDCITEIEI
jgi:hypothetical protein